MLRITLDPGHGASTNASPLDPSFTEGRSNYLFALVLKSELEKYEDVEVFITRNDVKDDPSLEERGKFALENQSDVFLSIHSNASSDPSAYGVEGYYSVKTPSARGLLEGLCNAVKMNIPDSKVRRVTTKLSGGEDYYGVLRASSGVKYSMLIEQGFHTSPRELSYIASERWRINVAALQARVFSDFFGLKKKEEQKPEEEPEIPQPSKDRKEALASIVYHAQKIIEITAMLDQPE